MSRPPPGRRWRTGDRVSVDEDGYLFFEGRTDDVIISAGYRIGPFEVESALVAHDRRRRGRGRRRSGRGARRGRPRRRRAPRWLRAERGSGDRAPGPRQTTRPRRTSTRGSSTSPPSSRRPRAARSSGPSFVTGALASLGAMSESRPAIGICTAMERAKWSVWEMEAALLPFDYIGAIQRAGGLALMIPPDEAFTADPDDVLGPARRADPGRRRRHGSGLLRRRAPRRDPRHGPARVTAPRSR